MTDTAPDDTASKAALASHGADPFTGRFAVPGDVAIAQRALMLAALSVGNSSLEGVPQTEALFATAAALRQLGVRIEQRDSAWQVHGMGVGGLLEPQAALNLSSTGAGLLAGLLAPYPFAWRLADGASRQSLRPVIEALSPTGLSVEAEAEAGGALTLCGGWMPLPVPPGTVSRSAQVTAALLLAAAQIAGNSTVVEPVATGDDTEKLLRTFGGAVNATMDETGARTIVVTGLAELQPRHVVVPASPVSASYLIVAALIVPGSDLIIEKVLVNPDRTGLIDTLLEMGGDIQFLNQKEIDGEHVADLRVRSSRLKGVRVGAVHAATMLDDIPALAIAAAYAQGETVIEGLDAMRGQPCDRLAATAAGLAASKITVTEADTSLTIGGDGKVEGGGTVASRGDASIAMSFLVLGLASHRKVTVDDTDAIEGSFPGFLAAMAAAGGRFEPVKGRIR
jgi:3-phosphoshikimate 1-carboxyvinyltransferase